MDTSIDLVDHFKLEVEQLPEYTQHTHYKSDRLHGLRRLKVVKKWRKKHDIGEGAFGIVWLEVEEDGSERAVKAISRRLCSYSKIDYRKELAAMAILSKYEELFVAFQGWFEDPEHIFVAMEYFKHGDLQRHMNNKMAEDDVKIVITQILEGLKTMHQLGFTHRDLKPQNIFVVDTNPTFWVKIGDFGITKRILNEQTFLRTEIGTPDYLAPEVLGYVEEETSRYTNAVDLWSLGCICHRLLTLESPFPKMTALARYCLGMTELPIEALYKSTVSEEAITLVKDLMNAQPSERINAEAALNSLWLKDVESLDSTFTVQSESHLPANTGNDLVAHDAEHPQDSKLPETSICRRETSVDTEPLVDKTMTSIDTRKPSIDTKLLIDTKPLVDTMMTSIDTRKKKREALYIENPSTTRIGQSPPSNATLRPALEHQISNTESNQQEEHSLFEAVTTVQELPVKELSRDEYLAARFRMAGHYPHVLALADHAFRWAAKKNFKDLMVYVLESGAPVDVNALLRSAEVVSNPKAITLLEAKRRTTNPLHLFTEPLYTACFYGQPRAVQAVLDTVPSVREALRSKDHRGRTALHYAVEGQYTGGGTNFEGTGRAWEEGEKLINWLLINGADPNQKDMNGETAPISAEAWEFYEAMKNGRLEFPSTPEETFFDVEDIEDSPDTTQLEFEAMEGWADTPQSELEYKNDLADTTRFVHDNMYIQKPYYAQFHDELSSRKAQVGSADEKHWVFADEAKKGHGHKQSWWRSLLKPERRSGQSAHLRA